MDGDEQEEEEEAEEEKILFKIFSSEFLAFFVYWSPDGNSQSKQAIGISIKCKQKILNAPSLGH